MVSFRGIRWPPELKVEISLNSTFSDTERGILQVKILSSATTRKRDLLFGM
jgi:hypothetical protein